MKRLGAFLLAVLLVASLSGVSFAAEVVEAAVCLDVQDREPVDPGDSFSADVGKVC